MNFYKFLRFSIIFLIILSWLMSGYPRIWENPPAPLNRYLTGPFPPEIQKVQAATTTIFLTNTASTTWVVPSDWSNTNTIEVIGGGGGGVTASVAGAGGGFRGGAGGGGGAYSKATNVTTLTAGATVTIQVGAGGALGVAGTDTFLCDSAANCASMAGTAVVVGAQGGGGASGVTIGAGGASASGVGATKFSGGSGGTSGAADNRGGTGGGGGGGAGGTTAVGIFGNTSVNNVGNNGTDGAAGGAGGATSGGAGGTAGVGGPADGGAGGNGGAGTAFDPTHGAGGGGGGGGGGERNSNGGNAGTSGLYGAGGAGGGGVGKDGATSGTGQGGRAGLIVIAYTPATFNQSAYRWFQNTDSAGVGIVLANQDASSTIDASDNFRLRLLLHVSDATSSPGTANFKLQVASTTLANCTSTLAGFVDVDTASGYIRYFDNPTPTDGNLLTASSSDPSHNGDTTVNQTYEEANNLTVTSTIGLAKDGQWDFSLKAYSAPQTTAFCFKAVKSADGSNLNGGYTKIPEIDIAAAASAISCSTDNTSTSFGALTTSAVSTSTPNASTTMSCSGTASGCTLYVKDAGGGGNPGLWNSTSSVLVASASSTLVAGTANYGINATTTATGSGGALTIPTHYRLNSDVSTSTVGGLTVTNQTLASSTADVASREIVIRHKAAISSVTLPGNYNDTITYECTVN